MKKLLVILMLGMFLLSFASAWTSSEFTKDEAKSLDKLTNFGTYKIEETSWYDPLGIWTKETLKEIELKKNTEQCIDCLSEGTIVLNKDGTLIDDLIWKRSFDDGKTFVDWNGYTNWKLLVEEDVDVFETTCVDGKEIIDPKNGTSYFEQDCITSKVGTEKQWNNLDFKKEYKAGTYNYKIEGSKKASVTYDWVIKTNGELLDRWAVWGAVIGEGGVEASVTLNAPSDASTSLVKAVTTNASANVTNGAYLTNATLYDNSTGTWGARNTSVVASSGYASGTNIEYQTSYPSNGPSAGKTGLTFTPKVNIKVSDITKFSSSNANRAYIQTAYASGIIAQADFSGDTATFSEVELTAGTKYWLLVDAQGSSYNIYYNAGAGTYPQDKNNLWINASVQEIGSEGNIYYSIVSFTTNNKSLTTSSTQTFTNTYSAGDNILWNMQFCDSDGDCGFAVSNRTFSIDSSAPTITLNYPTSLIDYGKLNGSLQLNFTATDSNLDKVWYDYNGTNVTIAGAVSGVYNISNITLSTKKNVTIYANDTAGNLNATTFSWDYKIFENSRTHNTTSYETAYENYQINVTANSSLTAVALVFNGTDYPMTGSYTYSRDLPTSSVGNNSIRYKFTYGAETIYSDYSYQNVSSTVLALCNATYSVPYLNITFKDEATLGNINATMPLGEFDYYLGSGTVTKQLQFINTSENSMYSFCASPSTRTLNIDPYVQYASSGYPQRIWNSTATSYTNTTTSQVLYLLSSSDGIYVTFQVINPSNAVISSVEVSVTREISGSDVVVGTGTTGTDGTVTFWLNPDFTHDFSFSKAGFTTYEASFAPTQTSYTITMGGTGTAQAEDYTRGVTNTVRPSANAELFNGTTYNFNYTISSSYWDIESFGFILKLNNGTVLSTQSSSGSGIVSANLNTQNYSRIIMDYYYVVNGTYTNYTSYWRVQNSAYNSWSILNFFNRADTYMAVGFFGIDDFGRNLLIFLILFVSVGIMSYKYGATSPISIMAIIFGIIFFFDVAVSWIPNPVSAIPHFPTFISGIILAAIIMKEVTQ